MRKLTILVLGLVLSIQAFAVTLPYTFSTTLPPSQVNANFSAVRDAINAHEALTNGHNTDLEDVLTVNNTVGSSYINFNLKELFSARVENLGSDPSCAAGSLGRLIWNTADGLLKVCNGTSYVSVAGTGVNTLASVLTAGNTASTDIDLDSNELLNVRVENRGTDPSPGAAGRLFYHTGDSAIKLDTGSAIQTIGGAQNLSSVLSTGNAASTDIDFDGNQAIDLYAESLSSDPGGSSAGRVYYNSVDNILKFHNGSGWLEIGNTNGLSDVLSLGNSAGSNGINLNGNQLTNVIIHKNSGSPSSGVDGQFWFDTGTDQLQFGATAGNQTVASLAQSQTLTNKTISGSSNTLTNIQDSSLSANVALLDSAQTVSGKKTFSTPPVVGKIEAASGGQHTIPDVASDTFALLGASQTFTNKSFSSLSMLGSLDFNDNAIQDFKLQSLVTNPSVSAGKLYYNSANGELRYSTGSEWRVLTSNAQGLGLDALSALSPLAYDNTTGVFSMVVCPDGETHIADSGELTGWRCGTAGGVADAADLTYTPTTASDWTDPDPVNGQEALDDLAGRLTVNESATTSAQADATQGITDAATADGKAVAAQADADQAITDAAAAQTDIDNHIADTTGAHASSAISVTPAGNLSSTDVQAALEELQTDIDSGGGAPAWGTITGTLSDQTDLQSALDLKAPLASPAFTGTVTLPTGLTGPLKAASGVVSASAVNLASEVTGALPIANGGTGQTAKTAAFDALSPGTTKGDTVGHDGTNNIRMPVCGDDEMRIADSGEATGWRCGPANLSLMTETKEVVSTITGSSSNPTKGTTAFDKITYSRIGNKMVGEFTYIQTSAGSAGSGIYLIAIPEGLSFGSKIRTNTETGTTIGSGRSSRAADSQADLSVLNVAYAYDSTHIAVMRGTSTDTLERWNSSGAVHMGQTNLVISFSFSFDIAEWEQATTVDIFEAGDYGWTAYTPTFTNFGTESAVEFFHRRVGDSLQIKGKVTFGSGGSGSAATISLPTGLTLASTSKMPSRARLGTLGFNVAVSEVYAVAGVPGESVLRLAYDASGSGGFSSDSAGSSFNNTTIYFYATDIPIDGWSTFPIGVGGFANSSVYLSGSPASNGGSTNGYVRRFATVESSVGTDLTATQSATLGDSVAVNEDGVYSITYSDYINSGASHYVITVNSTTLTSAVGSLSYANGYRAGAYTQAGYTGVATVTLRLNAGDVIRAQYGNANGAGNSAITTPQLTYLVVTKVSS